MTFLDLIEKTNGMLKEKELLLDFRLQEEPGEDENTQLPLEDPDDAELSPSEDEDDDDDTDSDWEKEG